MLNDALMVAIILTLVFGSVIFYLYNRLSMTERKMGLFEGVLTDLKIMMDSAPFAYGAPPPNMREFDTVTPEYLNAISGPVPLQNDEVEDVAEEYQQTLEQALERAAAVDSVESASNSGSPYRTLQIDESVTQQTGPTVPAISVTKLSPDLDSMTVKELNALAKQRGLSVPAGTRRKDLIELLKKKKNEGPTESLDHVPSFQDGTSFDGASFQDGAPFKDGAPFDSAPMAPLEVTL